jgi:hypothetical protein
MRNLFYKRSVKNRFDGGGLGGYIILLKKSPDIDGEKHEQGQNSI